MSETSDETISTPALPYDDTARASRTTAPAAPRVRRGAGWLGWLLLVLAVAVAAYLYWRMQGIEQGHADSARNEQSAVAQLHDQIDAQQHAIDTARKEADAMRARFDDAAKVNESLRGQVLGLSERARLAEDAIANLADKRVSGHDALLSNEAEMLLVLGQERYRLFGDPAATIATYQLADTALGEANDAAFSTVRQTIHAEIDALNALLQANLPGLQLRIAQSRETLPQWPLAQHGETAGTAPMTSRWAQIFGQFIRVQRDDEAAAARNDPLLARALMDANLRDMQAALALRDPARLRSAVTAARAALAHDFDAQSTDAGNARTLFDDLDKAVIAPAAPSILGAALKELRNLRATQSLHSEPTAPRAPVQGQS